MANKNKGKAPLPARRQRMKAASKAEARTCRNKALLVGNGSVACAAGSEQSPLNIPGIDKDLARLSEVLSDPETAEFEVTVLHNAGFLEVRKAIASLASMAEPDDLLLLYYSGTSYKGQDGLLYLPVHDSDIDFLDATCLDSEFILSQLRRSKCRKIVLLVDGCHSGAFFSNNRGIPDGFEAITACGPDEVTYGDDNGGFFTTFLVDGLRGARADMDGDGIVTVEELFQYILKQAAVDTRVTGTTPQKWAWNLPKSIPLVHVRQRVFLSYKRTNSDVADRIVEMLESRGYAVWVDREDIGGGTRWRGEIESALSACDAVIFILSELALESDEIYKELYRAVELDKPIIPLSIDKPPLYGWYKEKLGTIQHIDYDAKKKGWEQSLVAALCAARKSSVRRT